MNLGSVLRRYIVEPLYYQKIGSPRLGVWRELEKSQFLPLGVLQERQWRKLQNILVYVERNNSFYKEVLHEHGLKAQGIMTPEDFLAWPVLTKKMIRKQSLNLLSEGFNAKDLLHFKTGGSTGRALDIYLTEECSEQRNACARRHDRWSGWEVGEPVAAIWGNPKLPKTVRDKMRGLLLDPVIYLDTMRVTPDTILAFCKEWRRKRPTLIFGHAHSIFLLAEGLLDLGINDITPKGIISSSMMLLPHERVAIERVFGVKVTDRYGCEEVSLIGCECERHEGMHLNIDHLYIEFLREDGMPVEPGEEGRIVVTDLLNMSMPLIRYQVEDVGIPTGRICDCGRGLPLMERVTGRVADFLVRKDGSKVAGISLIENTLTYFPGLDQMQIVQNDLDHLQINIVRGDEWNETVMTELKQYFISQFGSSVHFDFLFVNEISPEKNGKYRFSICKIH